jgi:hypothetical protein
MPTRADPRLGENPGVTVDAPEQPGWAEEAAAGSGAPTATRTRRPLVAGAVGAAWALVVGVALVACLVMLAWAVAPHSAGNSAAAWRSVGAVWLGAHLVPLQVSGDLVTLLPIGGLLLGLLLNRRGGRWAGRMLPDPSAAEATWIVLGAGLAYGAGGAGVAWLAGGGTASADPIWAAVITGTVAACGTLWGLAVQAELVPVWRRRTRDAVWRTLLAGIAAVTGLFAAGAVLTTASLVRHLPEVAGTLADLDPGGIGAAALTLLGALSLPNLDIWAMSVLAGPGFDLGGLGGLSAFGGQVEPLPALPVLAAIPTTVPAWAPVLLVVPVALGILAGRVRWGRDLPTLTGALASALGLGAVVAALVGGLVVLSSGSLGGDRLARLGPDLVAVTVSATGLVLLGFLVEAGSQSLRLSWDLHRAERRAALRSESTVTPAEADTGGGADAGIDAGDPIRSRPDDWAEPAPEEGSGGGSRAIRRRAAAAAGRVAGTGGAMTGRVVDVGTSAASAVGGVGASAVAVVSSAGASAVSVVSAAGSATLARFARPEPGDAPAGGDAGSGEVEDSATDGVVDLRGQDDAGIDLRDPLGPPDAALDDEGEDPADEDADREPMGAVDAEEPGAGGDPAGAEEVEETELGEAEPGGPIRGEGEDPESAVPGKARAGDDTDEIPIVVGPSAD